MLNKKVYVSLIVLSGLGGWNQGLFDVTAGTHKFTWQFNQNYGGTGYIDYVVFPK